MPALDDCSLRAPIVYACTSCSPVMPMLSCSCCASCPLSLCAFWLISAAVQLVRSAALCSCCCSDCQLPGAALGQRRAGERRVIHHSQIKRFRSGSHAKQHCELHAESEHMHAPPCLCRILHIARVCTEQNNVQPHSDCVVLHHLDCNLEGGGKQCVYRLTVKAVPKAIGQP